jgi:hypothetical protein
MCMQSGYMQYLRSSMNPVTQAARSIGHREGYDFESSLGHGRISAFSLYLFSLSRQAFRRADPPSEDFY